MLGSLLPQPIKDRWDNAWNRWHAWYPRNKFKFWTTALAVVGILVAVTGVLIAWLAYQADEDSRANTASSTTTVSTRTTPPSTTTTTTTTTTPTTTTSTLPPPPSVSPPPPAEPPKRGKYIRDTAGNLYVIIDGVLYPCDQIELLAQAANAGSDLKQAASQLGRPPGDPFDYPLLPQGVPIADHPPTEQQLLDLYRGLSDPGFSAGPDVAYPPDFDPGFGGRPPRG